MGVPGRSHPEAGASQAAARQLQSAVESDPNPILQQVLRSWSDSTDIRVLEEALKLAAESRSRTAIEKTLDKLRSNRRTMNGQPQAPDDTAEKVGGHAAAES